MMLYICSQMQGLPGRVSFGVSIELVLLFGPFFFPLFSSFSLDTKTASVMRSSRNFHLSDSIGNRHTLLSMH